MNPFLLGKLSVLSETINSIQIKLNMYVMHMDNGSEFQGLFKKACEKTNIK